MSTNKQIELDIEDMPELPDDGKWYNWNGREWYEDPPETYKERDHVVGDCRVLGVADIGDDSADIPGRGAEAEGRR